MREVNIDKEFTLYDNKFNVNLNIKIQEDCWSNSSDYTAVATVKSLSSVKYYFEQQFSDHGRSVNLFADNVIETIISEVKAELSPIKAEVDDELTKQEWRNYFTRRWQAGEH
jgi:hypothetical protein